MNELPIFSARNLQAEIAAEIAAHPIVVFSKGTDETPKCGFTRETARFFERLGVKAQFIDVKEDLPKREALSKMTDWPTLPKVFIAGEFYGDTDVLGPMADNGELLPLLQKAFPSLQA